MENTIKHESSEPAKTLREMINNLLIDKFGVDTVTGLPMWRVSWANDQYEKKLGTYDDITPSGVYLRTVTEVREVPKYSYLRGLYILENLQGIPSMNAHELPTATLSYECMHPYMHIINETYLPPNWLFTEWVIDCYYAAQGKASLRKYVDPDADGNNGLEAQRKRVDEITNYLYGNDTAVTDHLSDGSGVSLSGIKPN